MPVRIIVNGAKGKMGSLACKAILSQSDFILVGELGRDDNLKKAIVQLQPDIVIDLTNAHSAYTNSLAIVESGCHAIIGTSGLQEEQIKHLAMICSEKKLGAIIVPNFSIAAILMIQFAARAAKFFPEVEIIESHHQEKLDAPSGTAIKTAEMIAANRISEKNQLSIKEIIKGARGALVDEVNVHSIRLPGILAKQEVIFGNLGETLSLVHQSIDRNSFMPGLILACKKVQNLTTLHYGLEDLLDMSV